MGRAPTSAHQGGSYMYSYPRFDVINGLSLVLVLILDHRVVLQLNLHKNRHFQIQSDLECEVDSFVSHKTVRNKILLVI